MKVSRAHTYDQLLSVVVTPRTFCSVAWCVWKNTQIKGQNHQYQSQTQTVRRVSSMSRISGERTKWRRTFFLLIYSTENPNYKNTFDLLLCLQGPKLMSTKCQMAKKKNLTICPGNAIVHSSKRDSSSKYEYSAILYHHHIPNPLTSVRHDWKYFEEFIFFFT